MLFSPVQSTQDCNYPLKWSPQDSSSPPQNQAVGESQKESEVTATFSLEIAPILRLIGRHLGSTSPPVSQKLMGSYQGLSSGESESVSCSVMSKFLQSHGLQPTRLLRPWNSPGKSTGVGSHPLLQGDLPDPGIEPGSPALQADPLLSE